ncbi:hypothetical protein ANN_23997 [Periplaneta americana]|uniref:Uncharacterized protein n=1 Tax=Periplaneta americana TaxID=6978 RepID=A0ABQ8S260_PERAM|nr:hypothetical protein ANN_23997 [Periplaneta americana]
MQLLNRLAEEIARTKLQSEMNGISPPMYSRFQGLGLSPPDMFTPGFTGAYHNQRTWSPSTTRANRERKASLQDLERMYTSLSSVGPQVPPIPQHRRRRHSGGMPWIRGLHASNIVAELRKITFQTFIHLGCSPTIK